MTKSFWPHSNKWGEKISAAKRAMLVLDFDGTLAPLVDHPSRARLNPASRKRLAELAESCDLAVVSGRSLGDVRRRVGGEKAVYGGNHWRGMAGTGVRHNNRAGVRL